MYSGIGSKPEGQAEQGRGWLVRRRCKVLGLGGAVDRGNAWTTFL